MISVGIFMSALVSAGAVTSRDLLSNLSTGFKSI